MSEETNIEVQMQPVTSSQISEIGHDPNTNTLAIRFKKYDGSAGSLYHYDNFTTEDFEAFAGAESLDRHFSENIKHNTERYPYRKVG